MEHNPRHVANRLHDLQNEMETIYETVLPLTVLEELNEHAQECVSEMNWFSKRIFNRSLVKEIESRIILNDNQSQENSANSELHSTALIWKDQNNNTRSVIVDAMFENAK